MENTSLKRPKPGEDEEELLRMQEEFLRSMQRPAAKVINPVQVINKDTVSAPKNKVSSQFSKLKKFRTESERISTSQTGGDVINPSLKDDLTTKLHDAVQNIPIATSGVILGNIIERKHENAGFKFTNEKLHSDTGFPEVFVSERQQCDDKQSLFLQSVKKNKSLSIESGDMSDTKSESIELGTNSAIVEGPWSTEIHQENVAKLKQMSQEEILKEKSRLEETLDPALIQFIKNRRNKKYNSIKNSSDVTKNLPSENKSLASEKKIPNNEMSRNKTEQKIMPQPSAEIFEKAKQEGWVHMDSVEPEKLQWMADLPETKNSEPSLNEPYSARFDFNGVLLPYKDESLSVDKGLHHHGEEPDRPGYSLQELLQLSRSSTQQQRCMALTTLANIIEKSRKGWYDKALHPAPLVALSQRNVLLLLRFSLDDTSTAIVTATLQALRAFLFSEADELCLDRLFGLNSFTEPALLPPPNDVKNTSSLKDHELAQLDAIAALSRSDINLRIRYIISEMQPPPIGVNCALEILIRLARHSHITALNIASTPYLLETIIRNFMPLSTDKLATNDAINNLYGTPVVNAVRFCRILVCYGGKAIAEKLDNMKIMQPILSYISNDAGKSGFNLAIESLRLWKLLLHYDVGSDSVRGAFMTLKSQLQLLLSNFDIGTASELACEHAATLITVAVHNGALQADISVLLLKWSTQLTSITSSTWGKMKLFAQTLLSAGDVSSIQKSFILNSHLYSTLCSTSNLLSTCVMATEREPSSLPSLGVLTENGQVQPIVLQQSCIPFLGIMLNVFCEYSFLTEIEKILCHSKVRKYLKELETAEWCLERSWYTRTELIFLCAVVKAAAVLKNKLDLEIAQTIWKVAIKLVSSLPADASDSVKQILRIVLLNENLRLEIVRSELANLDFDRSEEDAGHFSEHNIIHLYERYVTSNKDWKEAAMPKDWLYLPLVHIYSKCRNNENYNEDDKKDIITVLSLELSIPDIVEQLSVSLRFSRLILVYLCDTLYLHKTVSVLLSKIMTNLLQKHYKKLDFTTEQPGLSSFTDLFTAMCEHFCSTSYGDNDFAVCLIAPIAQRHDVHYRKLFWSEHAGVLRYLRLPLDKLVIPLKEYLYPLEEDSSLIESYLTALVRGGVKQEWCPLPYTIAIHHSAMYIKGTSKLSVRIRKGIEQLPNKSLVNILLHYEPPEL